MKRYEIKCCIDSKSTDIYCMAELAAFCMLDQLISLDVPECEKYVDLIDHERKIYKHITGIYYRDVVLTSWRDINTNSLYNF